MELAQRGHADPLRHAGRRQTGDVRRGRGRGSRRGCREFAGRFRELLQAHGTDGAFYGHASVGCLHIRPVLNLKDRDDVARMRRITEDVTDLVLEYGGSLSGEHGDGYVRSEWNRKMFGPVVYEAFREVKRAFDPRGLLNPGKVVDAPPMTEQLRYAPPYRPADPPTVFDLRQTGRFHASGRNVQRQRRLPQAEGRDDVPVLSSDPRRAGHDPGTRQCPATGYWHGGRRFARRRPTKSAKDGSTRSWTSA